MRAVLDGNKTAVAMLIEAGSEVNHQDSKVCLVYFKSIAVVQFFVVVADTNDSANARDHEW
jgi:hypothetical protein